MRRRRAWIASLGAVTCIGGRLGIFPLSAPHFPEAAALMIGIFQLVNSGFRGTSWKTPRLRSLFVRELTYGCVFLAVGVLWLVAGHTLVTDLLGLAVLWLPAWDYPSLQRKIYAEQRAVHIDAGTTRVRRIVIRRDGEELGTAAATDSELPLHRGVNLLLRQDPGQLMSRTRFLISYVAASIVIVVGVSVAQDGLGGSKPSNKSPSVVPRRASKGASVGTPKAPGPSSQNPKNHNAPPETVVPTTPPGCTSPGYGAPAWAIHAIAAQYREVPNAPGTTAAGCTGLIYSPSWAEGEFVYAYGSLPSAPPSDWLSLVVDSKQFGPALFLAPATIPVNALIQSGLVVGGSPRVPTGNGDMYEVTTEIGTYVLVRAQTHAVGQPSVTTGYTELPPAAVTAWVYLMTQAGAWLWPHIEPAFTGGEVFTFSMLGFGRKYPATMTYSQAQQKARLSFAGRADRFSVPPTSTELAQLLAFAKHAQ